MDDNRIHDVAEFESARLRPKRGNESDDDRRVCCNASIFYQWLMQNCSGSQKQKQENGSKEDFKRLCNEHVCAIEFQDIVKKTIMKLPSDCGDVSICMSALRDVIESLLKGRCVTDSES